MYPQLFHEPRFQRITAVFDIVDGLFLAASATGADIFITDIEKGIIRHLFMEEISQILCVERQHLNRQPLYLG